MFSQGPTSYDFISNFLCKYYRCSRWRYPKSGISYCNFPEDPKLHILVCSLKQIFRHLNNVYYNITHQKTQQFPSLFYSYLPCYKPHIRLLLTSFVALVTRYRHKTFVRCLRLVTGDRCVSSFLSLSHTHTVTCTQKSYKGKGSL